MSRISGLFSRFWSPRPSQDQVPEDEDIIVRVLGARGSGKTSFLYKLYFKHVVATPDEAFDVVRTDQHNVETIPYLNQMYEIWEYAEMSHSIPHLSKTNVIIFFIDSVKSSVPTVAEKARENMLWLLTQYGDKLSDTIIITVANKQDEADAVSAQDIGDQWMNDAQLREALNGHQWRIFPCSTKTGDGLDAIFNYLNTTIEHRQLLRLSVSSAPQPYPINNNLGRISPSSKLPPGTLAREAGQSPSPDNMDEDDEDMRKKVRHQSLADFAPTSRDRSLSQARMPITPWEEMPNPYHLSDNDFKNWYDQGRVFLFFDYQSLLRISYIYLRQLERTHERRSEATRRLLNNLRVILRSIELFEQDAKQASQNDQNQRATTEFAHECITYSETQTLFWLHMVSYCLMRNPVLEGEDVSFEQFVLRCPELWDGELWRNYYSYKTFHSELGNLEFLAPDKKPLPNAFKSSSLALKGSGLNIDYQIVS
ncbi:P-loop containing nucleoside triphosphate hydrolase protein [Umbelopsis sp. PMI_123]|nr:P-loop containing nucleoside triphosphate hydrolase protein [Umbelopsis sp. PMI_123]